MEGAKLEEIDTAGVLFPAKLFFFNVGGSSSTEANPSEVKVLLDRLIDRCLS